MVAEPADGAGRGGVEHEVVIEAEQVAVTTFLSVPGLA